MSAALSMEAATEAGPPVLTLSGHRATIRLNRPRHMNRIEPGDLAALVAHCEAVDADPALRVLVLEATGKSFSAGYHLGDLEEGAPRTGAPLPTFEEMVNRLEAVRALTICRLQGGVYGGSTDLALACDFRVGAEGIEMFMPAGRLGVHYYEGGLRRYVSRLGLNAAKRLFLTAEKLNAAEMLSIGYLTELVPAADLDARVDALADHLTRMAPLAVQGMKRALDEIARDRLDATALRAREAASKASSDLQEGLAAFREKRAPVFQGR